MGRLLLIALLTGLATICLVAAERALGIVPLPTWLAGIDGAISGAVAYWLSCLKGFRHPWRDPCQVGYLVSLLMNVGSFGVRPDFPSVSEWMQWTALAAMLAALLGQIYRRPASERLSVGPDHDPRSPEVGP
jgi:hypothetical protein